MTFNTNNIIKETDNAKKTRMKTPKTRSTKKKTKKREEKVFTEPPFSPLMTLENDDFDVKGEGRKEKFNMPPSTISDGRTTIISLRVLSLNIKTRLLRVV